MNLTLWLHKRVKRVSYIQSHGACSKFGTSNLNCYLIANFIFMFYDVLWCFMGNEPFGWNRIPTLPRSLYWLLHRPSRVKLFRNFRTQPSRAAAPAWRMESMKYHGILKILESGMVNGCHTTNINQPQKIAIASSWHCLHCFWKLYHLCTKAHAFNVRRQLPPSDDLPCATLPAMVGDPLPALPTVKLGVAQSAHCNHCILFLLPKLSALWWCSRFFMVFPLSTDPKDPKVNFA